MKIRQYCSVCKAEYDMEVVPAGDGDDDPVVWLRCPSCEGYLPKIRDSKAFQRQSAVAADEASPAETAAAADDIPAPASDTRSVPAAAEERPAGDDTFTADTVDGEETVEAASTPDTEAAEREETARAARLLEAADLETAVPYRPWQSYQVGDVIHHLAWDDYGVVLAKETLPGNRQVVKVHFGRAGTVRLIENDGSRP